MTIWEIIMRRSVLFSALVCSFVSSVPAYAALGVNAKAPDFTAQAALAGKPFQFTLAKALRKGPVVLYFFPKAFTKGCTLESNQFAEATEDFKKHGATVIGMSADNIETLKKFSTTECRSKFAVATANPVTIKAYDVKMPIVGMSNRTSYVIAPDGTIAFAYSSMDYREHVTKTLAAVAAWKALAKHRDK
jgi:thioredoxin-dependent peroxiredoxin